MTPAERGRAWMDAMGTGDFEAAWRQSDALRRQGVPDPDQFWQGEPLEGRRVVVRSLHGFGDAVQMLRYAPLLADRAAEVTYEVDPRFAELAPFFAGVTHIATWDDPPTAWDVQIEVMELPYLFRTLLEDLPLAERYLQLEPALVTATAGRMGQSRAQRRKPRIGIVWEGGVWDRSRWLPLGELAPLLAREGCEFWNLQGGVARDLLGPPVRPCGEGLLELAAIVANLDLVVTVDSLAAHLAGALGKRVWVMLPHAADWRWMRTRTDSPWYPGMRLFRQREPGGAWAAVVAEVCAALEEEGWASAREEKGPERD